MMNMTQSVSNKMGKRMHAYCMVSSALKNHKFSISKEIHQAA